MPIDTASLLGTSMVANVSLIMFTAVAVHSSDFHLVGHIASWVL